MAGARPLFYAWRWSIFATSSLPTKQEISQQQLIHQCINKPNQKTLSYPLCIFFIIWKGIPIIFNILIMMQGYFFYKFLFENSMGNSVHLHYQKTPKQHSSSQTTLNRSKISVKNNHTPLKVSPIPHNTQPIRLSALRRSLSA